MVVDMVIPKLEFRYSRIYLERLMGHEINEAINSWAKYSVEVCGNYWKPYATAIPEKLSEISGLGWKEEHIPCYMVGPYKGYSDPLSVSSFLVEAQFIDILTHELIHRLLMQNLEESKGFWHWIHEKYGDEKRLVTNHIPVHAIHKKLYLEMGWGERLENDIDRAKTLNAEAYIRAWDIVDKEGYENIIGKIKG